jgi:hypothetical protein
MFYLNILINLFKGGDGDGLGFILDIWKSDDDINNGEEPIDSFQFWFEVYED